MYSIEIEVSEELFTQIDKRIEEVHAQSRADYIRDIKSAEKAKIMGNSPLAAGTESTRQESTSVLPQPLS